MAQIKVKYVWVMSLIVLLAYAAVLPGVSSAASCNGNVEIDYVSGPQPAVPGDTLRVRLTLYTGTIDAGTQLTWEHVRFDLACDVGGVGGIPCTPETPSTVVLYEDNITASPTCVDAGGNQVSFTANSSAGNSSPNEVVFSPNLPFVLPAGTPASSGCQIEFDVQVASYSNDATPNQIEEFGGFRTVAGVPDASCDNGLSSTQSGPGSILLRPPLCGNGVIDPGETCDPPGSMQFNGKTCRADCTFCGDGIINDTETCDPGASPGCIGAAQCRADCSRCLKHDPSVIQIMPGNDRVWLHGRFEANVSVDPTQTGIGVRVSQDSGGGSVVIFDKFLDASKVTRKPGNTSSTVFIGGDDAAKTGAKGGVSKVRFVQTKHWDRVTAEAWGDLSAATTNQMTIEVYFRHEQFSNSGTWKKTRLGWLIQK